MIIYIFCFLLRRRPPSSTRTDTLFPYTTLFRSILVSVIVSLTLTPMLCSRFIKHHDRASHGRLYLAFERGFDLLLGGYKRGLHLVLRHPFITLCSFLATVAATIALFVAIPKGFFPQQDTGYIRSEERSVGQECVSTFRSRGSPAN